MIKQIMIKLTRDTCTYNLNDVWGDEGEVVITSSTYLARVSLKFLLFLEISKMKGVSEDGKPVMVK